MRAALAFVALALSVQPGWAADRAASPADATVFVRLVGSVHADITELGAKRTMDLERVEIGTGSGFVISPDGHVLTNDHVVSNRQILIEDGLTKVALSLKVSRIEVCVPPESTAARTGGPACVEASIAATNPELDLAVLYVTGMHQPYLPLGDSDVLSPGQPVQALGFPFGRTLNLGRDTLSGVVPEITTSNATVSALRSNDSGTRRFVQIDGNVNPGNSGGPLVNRDGFAVGVIQSRLKDASGIAFAIPINQVKDFLESRGLDQLLPTPRLRLGGMHRTDAKALGLRLPEGLADVAPDRLKFETDPGAAPVALRIDRVLSPWTLDRLERELLEGRTFERLSVTARESRAIQAGSARGLAGRATAGANAETGVAYAVLDLGREKLLARFIGSRDAVAFNESVLRDALASLEAGPLIAGAEPLARMEWSSTSPGDGQRALPVPAGWLVESGGPSSCARLTRPEAAGSVVSQRDFSVALRLAIWPGSVSPEEVSAACWPARGSLGAASYQTRAERLGTAYVAEGILLRSGSRVLQVEVSAPAQQGAYARALLAQWVKRATE